MPALKKTTVIVWSLFLFSLIVCLFLLFRFLTLSNPKTSSSTSLNESVRSFFERIGNIVPRRCSVSLLDETNYFDIKIVNRSKFKAFVKKYVKCEDGVFVLGNLGSGSDEYKVSELRFVFTDSPQEGTSIEKGNLVATWSKEFEGNDRIAVSFQIGRSDSLNLDSEIPFLLVYFLDSDLRYGDSNEGFAVTDPGKLEESSLSTMGVRVTRLDK